MSRRTDRHKTREEIYFVVAGKLQFKLGDDVVELGKHEAIRVPPQTWRGVWNDESEGAELIIVSNRSTIRAVMARRSRTSGRKRQPEAGPPMWSSAGEGESLWFLGTLATIRVPGEAIGDRFSLIEFVFPQGASPPLHTHPQDESYIVLEGALTIQAGNDRFVLEAGGAAAAAGRATHHSRREQHRARARPQHPCRPGAHGPRRLPAGRRAATPPEGTARPSPEQLEQIFRAHGQVNLGPPLTASGDTATS